MHSKDPCVTLPPTPSVTGPTVNRSGPEDGVGDREGEDALSIVETKHSSKWSNDACGNGKKIGISRGEGNGWIDEN